MKVFNYLTLTLISLTLLNASPSMAALTGSITLTGVVQGATAINVSPVSGSDSLDLSTTAVDKAVANVQEINNTTNGYTVTLSSSNAGKLKNGTVDSMSYTAKYNSAVVTLSSTPAVITTGAPSNSVVNVSKPFAISYTGKPASTMVVGTYSDLLTFTISAN